MEYNDIICYFALLAFHFNKIQLVRTFFMQVNESRTNMEINLHVGDK